MNQIVTINMRLIEVTVKTDYGVASHALYR